MKYTYAARACSEPALTRPKTRLRDAEVSGPVPSAPTMGIDTTFLRRCLDRLEACLSGLEGIGSGETAHRLAQEVCIERFEVALEQSGKLLRKTLRPWFASNRAADRLTFRDVFRYAAKHGLIDIETVERWLRYRDSRNGCPERDEDQQSVAATMDLLPGFLADPRSLAELIDQGHDD